MTENQSIHLERIATRPTVFEGSIAPEDIEGLDGLLANDEGELHYRITAQLEKHGRKVVSCIIEGFVFLTCQETMEVFRHPVSISDRLVLVDSESELPPIEEEGEEEDYVVAQGPIDVRDLVEEAVILALPMVPRKPGLRNADDSNAKAAAPKPSPFAVLASLKRPK
jgi:uncharacterized protein